MVLKQDFGGWGNRAKLNRGRQDVLAGVKTQGGGCGIKRMIPLASKDGRFLDINERRCSF